MDVQEMLATQNEMIQKMGKIVDLLQHAQDATLQKAWMIANAGESKNLPFPGVKSLYVDNTNNPNAFKIRLDGELGTSLVPANSGSWIACEGTRTVSFEGTGTCYILAMNRAIPPTVVNSNALVSFNGSQPVTFPSAQPVTINGSLPKSEMDIYGSTIADRPLASAVAVGTMFKAVTTQEVWQSNGTDWVVIV